MLHWLSLIIFFILTGLALWLAQTFMHKNGFFYFSIIAIVVSSYFPPVSIFGLAVNAQVVIIPILFYALYLVHQKYGSSESFKLFYISLISVGVMFIFRCAEYALLDMFSNENAFFNWANIKDSFTNILAYSACCVGAYFFLKYVKLQKLHQILRTAIYMAIFTAVNSLIFVIISTPGFFGFGDIIFILLTMLLIDVILSLLIGCYDFLTNKGEVTESVSANKTEPDKVIDKTEEGSNASSEPTENENSEDEQHPEENEEDKNSVGINKENLLEEETENKYINNKEESETNPNLIETKKESETSQSNLSEQTTSETVSNSNPTSTIVKPNAPNYVPSSNLTQNANNVTPSNLTNAGGRPYTPTNVNTNITGHAPINTATSPISNQTVTNTVQTTNQNTSPNPVTSGQNTASAGFVTPSVSTSPVNATTQAPSAVTAKPNPAVTGTNPTAVTPNVTGTPNVTPTNNVNTTNPNIVQTPNTTGTNN